MSPRRTPRPLRRPCKRRWRRCEPTSPAALCGVLMAGYGVMLGALPVGGRSGAPGRAYFLAAVASAGGLATGLASTCGAAIAQFLTTRAGLLVAMHLLFLLGALGRILAAVLGLRMVEDAAS